MNRLISMTAGAGGLPKRCGIVQNVQKITPNPVNFDSDKLVLRANKPRPIRIRITTMKNHDMERRMRTEQEFQQLYDELLFRAKNSLLLRAKQRLSSFVLY